ncbi:MAG: ATP-dependent 6-phosphofructokinase [Flavobacteriales endosymbiont of Rhyzopertha dominica]
MNAAIKTIVNYSNNNNINCYGIKYGYEGLIKGNFKKLSNFIVNNILSFGGTILGTSRSEKFKTKIGRKKAYNNIIKNKIDGLIVIGGDGTFTGAKKLYKEYKVPIIGIPGTIDNDIYGTDYTIGYDTSLNTIINNIEKIKDTAYSNNKLFIIEVMGKGLGFLALNSGISIGALDIFIPNNKKYNLKNIYNILKNWNINKYSNIIIVAENKKIGDSAKTIYKLIKQKFKNIDIRYNILGHVQRGGSPTYFDRILAINFGLESIKNLIKLKTNIVIGINNNKIIHIPFNESIKKKKKKFDKNIINIYDNIY